MGLTTPYQEGHKQLYIEMIENLQQHLPLLSPIEVIMLDNKKKKNDDATTIISIHDYDSTTTTKNFPHNNNDYNTWRIVLYYCYVPILNDVKDHVKFQKELCKNHNLNGRIRVSSESIDSI